MDKMLPNEEVEQIAEELGIKGVEHFEVERPPAVVPPECIQALEEIERERDERVNGYKQRAKGYDKMVGPIVIDITDDVNSKAKPYNYNRYLASIFSFNRFRWFRKFLTLYYRFRVKMTEKKYARKRKRIVALLKDGDTITNPMKVRRIETEKLIRQFNVELEKKEH